MEPDKALERLAALRRSGRHCLQELGHRAHSKTIKHFDAKHSDTAMRATPGSPFQSAESGLSDPLTEKLSAVMEELDRAKSELDQRRLLLTKPLICSYTCEARMIQHIRGQSDMPQVFDLHGLPVNRSPRWPVAVPPPCDAWLSIPTAGTGEEDPEVIPEVSKAMIECCRSTGISIILAYKRLPTGIAATRKPTRAERAAQLQRDQQYSQRAMREGFALARRI